MQLDDCKLKNGPSVFTKGPSGVRIIRNGVSKVVPYFVIISVLDKRLLPLITCT